jgi:putative FmdB family regulatory protein
MPIFEYACKDCGTSFEKLIRHNTAVECPSCGHADHLEQQYSTFAARADNASSQPAQQQPSCPGGMCQSPGMCGRNN